MQRRLGVVPKVRARHADDLAAAIEQMKSLNRSAAEVLADADVHAATDVTGFGLLGHGLEMARASGHHFAFEASALPLLDGALDMARAGVETGGARHNRQFVAGELTVADGTPPELITLAHDPQTSGGLLAALPSDGVESVRSRLQARGETAAVVGHVTAGSGISLT